MGELTENEEYILRWLSVEPQGESRLGFLAHKEAMRTLRERGLVRLASDPDWITSGLTPAGRATLEAQENG